MTCNNSRPRALWSLFAITLNVSLRALRGRPAVGALLGLAGGPLAYLGGEKLGAVAFAQPANALLALALMMPLLALYANALGVLGGMAVSFGLLGISPVAYWHEMMMTVTQRSINVGLIKATAFGLIVGLAGCLRGLQAERSAAGVGRAATSAVVQIVNAVGKKSA